jgi:uncharacterized protein involved in exopolysaccharide biosynthesis
MGEDSLQSITLPEALHIIRRHKEKALLFFLCTLVFVIVGLQIWPETYKPVAKLLVKLGRENASMPAVMPASQQVLTFGITKEQVNSEIEIIKSNYLIEKTVQELGPAYILPEPVRPEGLWKGLKYYGKIAYRHIKDGFNEILYFLNLQKKLNRSEEAISRIQKKLEVMQVKNSNSIDIELGWSDPKIGADIVNKLIQIYLEYRLQLYKNPGAFELFDEQVRYYKDRLAASENRLKEFRKEWGLISVDTQKKSIVDRIAELKKELQTNQTHNGKMQNEISEINKQLNNVTANIPSEEVTRTNPLADFLKGKLYELKLKKEHLLTTYLETSSTVANVNQEIAKVQQEIAKQRDMVKSSAKYVGLRPELTKRLIEARIGQAALKEVERSLKGYLGRYETDLQQLGEREIELSRLMRDLEIQNENYKLYVKKREELRVSSVMDDDKIANVSVVSFATAPFVAAKPKKMLIISMGLIFGLLGGIGMAFLSEYSDKTQIKSTEGNLRLKPFP